MADALPPNIQEFSEITAVVFAQLYIAHPMPKTLEPDEVAGVLGIAPNANLPSGRTFNEVFAYTVVWLLHQGYIFSNGHHPRDRDVLTDKALAVMNVVPPALGKSRGTELVEVTEQAASEHRRNQLIDLAGSLIGSIIRSALGG
jgi:hypothetical protein